MASHNVADLPGRALVESGRTQAGICRRKNQTNRTVVALDLKTHGAEERSWAHSYEL